MGNVNELERVEKLVTKALCAEDNDYFKFVEEIATTLPTYLVEQLQQLVNGPVSDGDIISKQYRDILIKMGIGIKVCCNGEQGFTGTRLIGHSILKAINEQYDLIISEFRHKAEQRPKHGVVVFN